MSLAWDLGIVSLFGIMARIWAGSCPALLQFGVLLVLCSASQLSVISSGCDRFILCMDHGNRCCRVGSISLVDSDPYRRIASSYSACGRGLLRVDQSLFIGFHRIGLNRYADPFFKPFSACGRRLHSSSTFNTVDLFFFKWRALQAVFLLCAVFDGTDSSSWLSPRLQPKASSLPIFDGRFGWPNECFFVDRL